MRFFKTLGVLLFFIILSCDRLIENPELLLCVTNALKQMDQDTTEPPIIPVVPTAHYDDSLLLSLNLNGNVENSSKYSFTIDPLSIDFGPDRNEVAEGALSFNGSDKSTLFIAHDPVLDFSAGQSFTISLWIKAGPGQMNNAGIITKGIAEKEQFSIDVVDDRYRFWVRDNNATLYIVNSYYPADDQWHKIDAIYNDTINKLLFYCDNKLIKTSNAPDELIKTTEPITIGCRKGWSSEDLTFRLKGLIDDVRIFNRALPPDDASLLLSLKLDGTTDNSTKYEFTIDPLSISFGADRNDISNRALSFNGSDESGLFIAHDSVLDFSSGQSFTISLWVKAGPGQMNGAGILSKGIAEKEQFGLDIVDDRYRFWVRDTNAKLYIVNSYYPADDKWHKIDAIYNDTINRLLFYCDNKLIETSDAPDALIKTIEPITIGCRKGWSSEDLPFRLKGLIDDVRIFNKVLILD